MAKKTSSTKADDKKVFSFVQEAPLVRQTEQTIVNGYQAIEEKEKGRGAVQQGAPRQDSAHQAASSPQTHEAEKTKGVQAYIPMSMYRRLNDLKYTRGVTIGNLLVQAIGEWLDMQK